MSLQSLSKGHLLRYASKSNLLKGVSTSVSKHVCESQAGYEGGSQSFVNNGVGNLSCPSVRYASWETSAVSQNKSMPWSKFDLSKPSKEHVLSCFIGGEFKSYSKGKAIGDPLRDGEYIFSLPEVPNQDLKKVSEEIDATPRSGLFNMYRHPGKYRRMGEVAAAIARELHKPEVIDYFTRLIQLTMPKSRVQAMGEMTIIKAFLENYSSDRIRHMMRGFNQGGDRCGQMSQGFRFPYGATAVVSPFNFPLEIVAMQFLGSVFVGNYCFVKPSANTSLVMEEFLRLCIHCGLPPDCVSLMPVEGKQTEEVLTSSNVRTVQFTGSAGVADRLSEKLRGKVKVEDAGFDVKILGPDAPEIGSTDWEFATYQCDQDAYAMSGQKCSATSFLAVHENWKHGVNNISASAFIRNIEERAGTRSWDNLTVSPLLGHNNDSCTAHIKKCLSIQGSRLLFGGHVGGKQAIGSSKAAGAIRGLDSMNVDVNKIYGSMSPTAVFIPLESLSKLPANHDVFSELFGPFQIVTEYNSGNVAELMKLIDRFSHHLTMGVVSQDIKFQNAVLGATIHGVTYVGSRARTTGAPQNHWFGPAGDPRAAGIGTDEAILSTWTCHREIVEDTGPTDIFAYEQS